MILDWKLCLLSALKVVSKKEPEAKKQTVFYGMPGEHMDRAIFQIPCVIICSKLSASQLIGKLCFCFGLFWVFFLTTSKLVNTVLGNKKWECLTLCGMWQQELVSASGEADSSSDTALVARSLLDKWGFVWILQYSHCSVLGGEMQYFRCLNTLPRWLQRPLPALQCDSASVHAAQNYTGIFCWPVAMPCPL